MRINRISYIYIYIKLQQQEHFTNLNIVRSDLKVLIKSKDYISETDAS